MTQTLPKPRHRCFAFMYSKVFEPSDKKNMAPFRQFAAGGAYGRVLELGAGTGANLDFYDWDRIESLELLEPDPYMAKYLRPKLQTLPAAAASKVGFHESVAESLPFADGEFDCAVVTLVLCTVADQVATLAELKRVLKPHGELRLVEHVGASGKTATIQRLIQPVYGRMSGDCQLTRNTEANLAAAGFSLEVQERTAALGKLWPTFVGLAKSI